MTSLCMTEANIERLLIVEDDPSLATTLAQAMDGWAKKIETCATVVDATAQIRAWHPQMMLLDMALPDGDAFDVLRPSVCQQVVPQVIVLSGSAKPAQTFDLAKMGVRAYLSKPIDLNTLERTVHEVLASPPDLSVAVRATVGYRSMRDVEAEIRTVMVEEAIARSNGSCRGAAKLLNVSRQMLQHALRRLRDQD